MEKELLPKMFTQDAVKPVVDKKDEKPTFYIQDGGIPYMKANFSSHPAEGGTLCYMEGMSTPYKGQPDSHFVLYSLDATKRLLKLSAKFASKHKFATLFLLPTWKTLLSHFNEVAQVSLRRHNIVIDNYCVSARELVRVGSEVFKTEAVFEAFVLIVSFYEFDWAYRLRSQFCLSLINKAAFNNNPYKELQRVWAEMKRREGDTSVYEKYIIFGKFLWLAKIPFISKWLKKFVNELNMSRIAFDEDDKIWASFNKTAEGTISFDFS